MKHDQGEFSQAKASHEYTYVQACVVTTIEPYVTRCVNLHGSDLQEEGTLRRLSHKTRSATKNLEPVFRIFLGFAFVPSVEELTSALASGQVKSNELALEASLSGSECSQSRKVPRSVVVAAQH